MKLIRALILALACCVASPLVLADEASDAFDQGSAAFNRQDYDAAFPLFKKAAEMGVSKAQFIVGSLYKIGYGTEKNTEKAREWTRKSAEQGLALAQVSLGEMFEAGIGGAKDLRQAFYWYNKAATQGRNEGYWGKQRLLEYGDAGSQFSRGVEYELGSGVPKDESQARHWFELAAAQGNPDAQAKVNFYQERDRKITAETQEWAARQQREAAAPRGPSYWEMQVEADRQKLQQMNADYNRRMNNTKPWDDNLRCHSTTEAGCRR